MNLLAASFGARASALVSFDAGVPRSDISIATGAFDDDLMRRYLRDFIALDPAPRAFSHVPIGEASSTDRMFTPEQIHASVFHNELFAPAGLVETLGGVMRTSGGRFEMFGLQRGKEREAFAEEDDRAIEAIIPHMARALQLRRMFLAQDLRISRLEQTLDRATAGILMIDGEGKVLFANAAMQTVARAADGLALDRLGRLVASDSAARRFIDAQIADVAVGGPGGITAVSRPSDRRPYILLVAPLTSTVAERLVGSAPGGALIVVHDPDADLSSPAELLQRGLGLPQGAAELSLALASGHDLKDFARMRGVTIHTARFHLRTALERTGAGNQAGLVKLVVRLLADLGVGGSPVR
jgi:DNA-binding CsgD family transcriptional regulator